MKILTISENGIVVELSRAEYRAIRSYDTRGENGFHDRVYDMIGKDVPVHSLQHVLQKLTSDNAIIRAILTSLVANPLFLNDPIPRDGAMLPHVEVTNGELQKLQSADPMGKDDER